MKKTTRFVTVFAFAFLLLVGLGSAFTVSPTSLTFSNPDTSKALTLTGAEGYNYTFTLPESFSIKDGNEIIATFNVNGGTSINGSNNTIWTVSSSGLDYSKLKLGKIYSSGNVVINYTKTNATNNTDSEQKNKPFSVTIMNDNYCKFGNNGNEISITDIDDRSSGSDWEWKPLKDIIVRVDVENNANSKKNIVTKLALYDSSGKAVKLLVDGTEENGLEESIRIDEDDEERFEFKFALPANIDLGEYTLYVKSYVKGDEESQCVSSFEKDIEIDFDEEVILDELEVPSKLVCGEYSTISFRLYNLDLGDDEYMRVNLYSQELGLNVYSHEFYLDEGDYEYIDLDFNAPTNKIGGNYKYTLYVDYDYRESSDTFRKSKSLGAYTIKLEGNNCKVDDSKQPKITATLDEDTETMVGKDLVLKIKIANPSEATDVVVALADYESWANSATLDTSSFSLIKDGTKTITATLNPTKSGEREFVVRVVYDGKLVEQRVSVEIGEGKNSFSSVFSGLKSSPTFWLTLAIFIVLILIVLVFLLRFARSVVDE